MKVQYRGKEYNVQKGKLPMTKAVSTGQGLVDTLMTRAFLRVKARREKGESIPDRVAEMQRLVSQWLAELE